MIHPFDVHALCNHKYGFFAHWLVFSFRRLRSFGNKHKTSSVPRTGTGEAFSCLRWMNQHFHTGGGKSFWLVFACIFRYNKVLNVLCNLLNTESENRVAVWVQTVGVFIVHHQWLLGCPGALGLLPLLSIKWKDRTTHHQGQEEIKVQNLKNSSWWRHIAPL